MSYLKFKKNNFLCIGYTKDMQKKMVEVEADTEREAKEKFGCDYYIDDVEVSEVGDEEFPIINLNNAVKTYSIPFEAWYADTAVKPIYKYPHINISLDSGYEGTFGEFKIEWNDIGMQLLAFEDSWLVFQYMPELCSLMAKVSAEEEKPTISEFAKMLDEIGFIDKTERVRRY